MKLDRESVESAQSALGKLSQGVIAGPDDLMGIGECLNLLDEIEAGSEPLSPEQEQRIAQIKQIFNRLILNEGEDPEPDWQMLRREMGALLTGGLEELAIGAESPEGAEPRPELAGSADSGTTTDGERSDAQDHPPAEEDIGFSLDDEDSDEQDLTGILEDAGADQEDDDDATEVLDPELLKDFVEEARENLSSIELNILSLETNPEDQDAINAVFRPFHSIKGVSGFLNLQDINRLSHQVENLLDAARSGTLPVTDRLIDLVLKGTDVLTALVERLESSPDPVREARRGSSEMDSLLQEVERLQNQEAADEGAGPVRKVGEILVDHGTVDREIVEEAAERSAATGRKIGEGLIDEGAVAPRDLSKALREQRHAREDAAYVRVATQKLDNLVDAVGELVIAQSMVLQNPEVQTIREQKLQKDVVQLSRITAELQRTTMSMRMVPIKATFKKLIRLVRDLAKKSGKEVVLEMQGEDTEIDRNMVDQIYEPLVHMIRNSADHGIEMPDEREKAGKNRWGTILVAAEQRAGNIIIDIKDDGRGLDANKIRRRAIERGVISEQDTLDESAVFELILHPGFSTKDQVTDVSGRGVGMDVVKKTVEQLKGKMEISSVLGAGSYFQLKLPLTMAIIDGMVIKVGEERYVVPTIALKESLRPALDTCFTVQNRGEMVKVRNTLMPIIRLHRFFEVTPRCQEPWEGLLLVVTENGRSFSLMADEIVGRQEVVIKGLGASMRHLKGISGGAILGDGRVALIVDVKGIVSLHEDSAI